MYTLVHMRLAARECIPRYALRALRPPSPTPPHPHRPDHHRESELASDNRVRFAPIEPVGGRPQRYARYRGPGMKIIIAF